VESGRGHHGALQLLFALLRVPGDHLKAGWVALAAGAVLLAGLALFAVWVFHEATVAISGDEVSVLLLSLVAGLYLVLGAPTLIRHPGPSTHQITNLLQLWFIIGGWGAAGAGVLIGPGWAFWSLVVASVSAMVWYMLVRCPRCHVRLGWARARALGTGKPAIEARCPSCGFDLRTPFRDVR
jgi:hypothetical protein